jgi:hypothetical protein
MVMGTGAVLGNYFWLIGILPKPEEQLMQTRWFYAVFAYVIGAAIAFVEP